VLLLAVPLLTKRVALIEVFGWWGESLVEVGRWTWVKVAVIIQS
jgi:hypothetical protein